MKRISAGSLLTTSPEAMSAFLDNGNYHRALEWAELPEEVKLAKKENDNSLLAFLNTVPVTYNVMKNPVIRYRRDCALATYTKLTADLAVDAESISVEDAAIFNTGHVAVLVRTGEEFKVASVNATNNTIALQAGSRGLFGPAFAAVAGDELRPGAPYIGERGTMKESYTTYPGDPCYNFITLSGLKFGMSKYERNAAMTGEWGTWDKAEMDAKFQLDSLVQEAMISQHRFTEYDSTEKQVYRGAGLQSQLSGNRLDLGAKGTNFLWEHLNDFITPMFVSDLSADYKMVFGGPSIWADALSTSRQMSAMDSDEIVIDPTTGAAQFTMYTTEGNRVVWNKVGGFDGHRSNHAFVLDPNNIGGGQYEGLGSQVFYDLQDNDDVLGEDAAVFTSWLVNYYERSTGGIIIGGTSPLIV